MGGDFLKDQFRVNLAKKTGRRRPNPTHEVFALGHYETMQIGLALQFVIDNWDHGLGIEGEQSNIDPEYLKTLEHIFGSESLITIIREFTEE